MQVQGRIEQHAASKPECETNDDLAEEIGEIEKNQRTSLIAFVDSIVEMLGETDDDKKHHDRNSQGRESGTSVSPENRDYPVG